MSHIKSDCNLHQCDAGCSLFMGCDIGLSYFADNALQFPGASTLTTT